MSVCRTISFSEISDASDYNSSDYDDYENGYRPGYSTVSLHPCHPIFHEKKDVIITKQNKETFNQTYESILESIKCWGPSIGYVRDEFINYELCKIAIDSCDSSICSIKPHLLTKDEYYKLCLQSVIECGFNIKYIPKKVQTQELVDASIKSSCWAISNCKTKYKTSENCMSAVKRNGQTLKHVPKDFINKDMCYAAVKSRFVCLNYIPIDFLSDELCEIAVKANGENIKYVPDNFMTTNLSWLSITSPDQHSPSSDLAGSNIKYISGKYLTKEIIVESAKRWYSTYNTIPKEYITEEIEDAVLDVSPYCIKYMKQTPERCMKAFKNCPYVLDNYIALENITKEMVEYLDTLSPNIKRSIKNHCGNDNFNYIISLLKK
jgi:hypothetical protein